MSENKYLVIRDKLSGQVLAVESTLQRAKDKLEELEEKLGLNNNAFQFPEGSDAWHVFKHAPRGITKPDVELEITQMTDVELWNHILTRFFAD